MGKGGQWERGSSLGSQFHSPTNPLNCPGPSTQWPGETRGGLGPSRLQRLYTSEEASPLYPHSLFSKVQGPLIHGRNPFWNLVFPHTLHLLPL